MLHYIITITLGIVATFLGVVTFYALRRINAYENIILNISNTIESIKLQLKVIDDKGTFESDDEVGFFERLQEYWSKSQSVDAESSLHVTHE